jgi:hypothetical protein
MIQNAQFDGQFARAESDQKTFRAPIEAWAQIVKESAWKSARAPGSIKMVRMKGLEPSRELPHSDLNAARLPFRHIRMF